MNGATHLPAIGLALMGMAASAARAEGPAFSAAELEALCDTADAAACVGYVRGFIDGVLATDRLDTTAKRGSWTERAARTRLGARSNERLRAAVDCLARPDESRRFLERLRTHLRTLPRKDEVSAREVVLAALDAHSPCTPP